MAAIPGNNSMIPAENVVMGVPKKGRLYDRCMKLLAGAGMDHRRVRQREPLLLLLLLMMMQVLVVLVVLVLVLVSVLLLVVVMLLSLFYPLLKI